MTGAVVAGMATARVGLSAHVMLWVILTAVLLYGTACLWIAGLQVDLMSTLPLIKQISFLITLAWIFWLLGSAFPKFYVFRRLTATLQDFFFSAAQLTMLAAISGLLIYLAANAGARFPMRDNALEYLDALLGFDWYAFSHWLNDHPMLDEFLFNVYNTILLQAVLVVVFNSAVYPGQCNKEFTTLFLTSIVITSFIFIFFPAVGMIGKLNAEILNRFLDIRAGSSIMNYSRTSSIISFPSYHTVMAILIPYSVRHQYWCLIPMLLINIIMLASVSPDGGHYLVDILAGAMVAAVSIFITRRCLVCYKAQ